MPSQSLPGNALAAKALQVLLPSELRLSTCKDHLWLQNMHMHTGS